MFLKQRPPAVSKRIFMALGKHLILNESEKDLILSYLKRTKNIQESALKNICTFK
jgi:hypothetical protein